MLGKTNTGTGSGVGNLNSSCVVWLPLNGNTVNYGNSDLTFMPKDSYIMCEADGNVYQGCYYNTGYNNGGLVSNKSILLGQNQSFFCWGKIYSLTSASGLGGNFGGQHRYDSNTGLGLGLKYISNNTGYLTVSTGTGTSRTFNTYCGSTLLNSGSWYHLGYTYDGSVIKLYVNGVLDGTFNVGTLQTPADYVCIAAWGFSGTAGNNLSNNYNLFGRVQDVRIYNKTLTDKEITKIYNYRPITKVRTKPVRYIRCRANSSSANTSSHWVEVEAYDENGINQALHKTVASVGPATTTSLSCITDGNLNSNSYANCGGDGIIQIDLGAVYNINYIQVRHYYSDWRTYYYVECLVSSDGINFEEMFNSEKHGRYREIPEGQSILMVPGK